MKYLLTAFLLVFCLCYGNGQNSKTLLNALERSDSDSTTVVAYQRLVNYHLFHNPDSAIYYGEEGLAFSRKYSYPMGEAMMVNGIGQVHERHGRLDLAKARYIEARELFREIGFRKGVAATTNGLGVIAGRTGKYDEATRHFLEALKEFEDLNDPAGLVQTYIKLGVVSDLLGDLDKALQYYLTAEKLNEGLPDSKATVTLLNNIGIIYGKRNDIPTALQYFKRGLRECDPGKAALGIHITLLGSLGTAYEKLGEPDSALRYQQQALSMARENNLPEEEARALVNMSSLFSSTDPDKSLALLGDALVITQGIEQLNLMTEVYEAMIGLHKARGDYKEALVLTEKRQELRDSLFNLEESKEIANLHAHQALAKQENEIRNLAIKNEKSIIQRNIMIVIALVSVAFIGIVWFYNTRISHLNSQLISKQTELKNSNSIKDKLFSILGHDLRAPLGRVIGLLNVLALKKEGSEESMIIEKLRQQSTSTLETLDNLLLWGQRQLKGIRLNQQTFELRENIARNLQLAAEHAAQKNIRLVANLEQDLWVHADPSHFDFIMRNILSNAIKFSHSDATVVVSFSSDSQAEAVVSIKDSGVGIPREAQKQIFTPGNESIRGTWNEKGTGIGLMLCREYVSENGGKLWLESEPGKGSTFYFSLRKAEGVARQEHATAAHA